MIENTGNKNLKIAFYGSEEYRHAIQEAALQRRLKVQGFLERAVAAYVDGQAGTAAAPPSAIGVVPKKPITDPHHEQMELLRYILDHGSKEEAGWITGNLKTFAEAIRLKKPDKAKRQSGK